MLTSAPTSVERIGPATASITDGTIDGNRHPAVVLIIMDIAGEPAFRCTGTLIAPKVVLTAGHCAGEPGEFSGLRVFTESNVEDGNNDYPFAGPNTIEAKEWHSHPAFTENLFFLHDVGVVILSKAVRLAANHAIDRQAINQAETLGFSKMTYSMIPSNFEFFWQPPVIADDRARAKQLLTEAGYPNGFDAGDFTCDAVHVGIAAQRRR